MITTAISKILHSMPPVPIFLRATPLWILCAATQLIAGDPADGPRGADKINFKVQSERQIELPQEQRKMVIQRVAPPQLPPPPVAQVRAPIDPVLLEQRRTAWRALAPLEYRLLSITAIVYENGWTFLSWWHHDEKGQMQAYEAWSQTDFRSLWLVPDFEVNRVQYLMCPSILDASWKYSGSKKHPLPGPLSFEGTPGFRIVKGDPSNLKAINPITALHQIYKEEGLELSRLWTEVTTKQKTDAEWLKANPPVPQDTTIRMWPKKSRRHAAEAVPVPQAQSTSATAR